MHFCSHHNSPTTLAYYPLLSSMWFFSNSKRLSELLCVCTCTGSAHLPPPPPIPPKVDGPWWCGASSAWRQSNGCFSCKHLKRNSNEKRLLLLLQLVYEHLTLTRGRTENVKSTNATAAAVVDGNGNGESACKKRKGKNNKWWKYTSRDASQGFIIYR